MAREELGKMAGTMRILMSALLVAVLAASAQAAEKKLYRWVDKNGQVHYGDSIPPEYAEQDRDVLNRQGVQVGREQGLVTEAEARAQAEAARLAREEAKRKLRDRVLLQTYQSVAELEVLRDRRLELVDAQLTIQEQSLANLRTKRLLLEKQASRYKPVNKSADAKPLPQELALDLRRSASDIATQQENLVRRREERENIRLTFEADMKRYQELRTMRPR